MLPEIGSAFAYHTRIHNLVSVCLIVIHSVFTYPISTKLGRRTKGHTMEVEATLFAPFPKGGFPTLDEIRVEVYRQRIADLFLGHFE